MHASAEQADQLCRQAGARHLRRAEDPTECAVLWKGRKSAFSAVGKITPTYYVQDGVVPRSCLPWVLSTIERLSREHELPVANMFHAGDGNLHPLILYSAGAPDAEQRVKDLGAAILRVCLDAGGSISGEHGVGADKRCYLDWMFSPEDLDTMSLLRQAFDPEHLANPGKVLPTPRTCGESAKRVVTLPAGVELY